MEPYADRRANGGRLMEWGRILAYITGTVDQELLLRNEYLAAENRILKAQLKGRLRLDRMTKIITLTPNPAIDLSTSVDRVAPTRKLRCAGLRRDRPMSTDQSRGWASR